MKLATIPVGVLLGVLLACGRGTEGTKPQDPVTIQDPGTPLGRALAVGAALAAKATPDGSGVSWVVVGSTEARPMDFYEGSAGIVWFLARLQQASPSSERATLLAAAGQRLETAGPTGAGIIGGEPGRVLAFLALHDALGGTRWLEAARRSGKAMNPGTPMGAADLLYAYPGHGFAYLELAERDGGGDWLARAQATGDVLVKAATPIPTGITWWYQVGDVQKVYPGMSHGNAGAGLFLAKLARRLGAVDGAKYLNAAKTAAAQLEAYRLPGVDGPEWPRRIPDQEQDHQWSWCHGGPGSGHFFLELGLGGEASSLATAKACGEQVWARREWTDYPNNYTCLCHGRAGNAQIYLALLRETGDATWRARAEEEASRIWSLHLTDKVGWKAGDGTGVNNPGLFTGDAGVGYFFLQLHDPIRFRPPIHR